MFLFSFLFLGLGGGCCLGGGGGVFVWVMLHMYLVSLEHTTSPSTLLLKGQEMPLKLELIGIEVEDSLILYPIHFSL